MKFHPKLSLKLLRYCILRVIIKHLLNTSSRYTDQPSNGRGHPERQHVPAEEEPGPGHDGPGAGFGQRQPAAVHLGVVRAASVLLLQLDLHFGQLGHPGGRGRWADSEQSVRHQRQAADLQGEQNQRLCDDRDLSDNAGERADIGVRCGATSELEYVFVLRE